MKQISHAFDMSLDTAAAGAVLDRPTFFTASEEEQKETEEPGFDCAGTVGSAGTMGGTFGTFGTFGCCC